MIKISQRIIFKIMLLLIPVILVAFLFVQSYTTAYYIDNKEESFRLDVALLTYDLTSTSSNFNSTTNLITVPASSTISLDVKIQSNNSINSKYQLSYSGSDIISYFKDYNDPTGEIGLYTTENTNDEKTVSLMLENTTASAVTIQLYIDGGYTDQILNIQNDRKNIPLYTGKTYVYTDNLYKKYTVPHDGYYQIELWGASSYTAGAVGGAYTSGIIELTKNELLYFYLGNNGQGYNQCNGYIYLYNGGGRAKINPGGEICGAPGGGATDVRLAAVSWQYNLESRIMVAGGAGGGYSTAAGAGGTLQGMPAKVTSGYEIENLGKGGGQTVGGAAGTSIGGGYPMTTDDHGTAGAFGYGGDGGRMTGPGTYGGGSGGGGGYYGGGGGAGFGNTNGVFAAGGGSSFISGYAGVNAVTSASSTTPTNNTKHYSGKYFIKGQMIAGNAQMPNPDGGTMVGNIDAGKAKITYIGVAPVKTKTILNNVRYIKDCNSGDGTTTGVPRGTWSEIQAMYNGLNVAKGKTVTGTVVATSGTGYAYSQITDGVIDDIGGSSGYGYASVAGLQCVTIDLGNAYNLDEIYVVHHYKSTGFQNHTLSVGSTNASGTTSLSTVLINNESGVVEGHYGKRINAY